MKAKSYLAVVAETLHARLFGEGLRPAQQSKGEFAKATIRHEDEPQRILGELSRPPEPFSHVVTEGNARGKGIGVVSAQCGCR